MASVLHVQNYFFTQASSITPCAGGLILAVVLVSCAVTASWSRTHHGTDPITRATGAPWRVVHRWTHARGAPGVPPRSAGSDH